MRVARELYDAELLDGIRPWMTLDSDPADHQRLNDQLESWSSFAAGDYVFVVRLASAGIYDRRAAYFAHGRAWRHDALPPGFDPGLHLGRTEVFDRPWRDESSDATVPDELPSLVRTEQLDAERTTATLFLAHLVQALAGRYPLIIAAPVAEFATGNALHALISFARGGLPAALRSDCRIRVYSRYPDLFLRHLGVNLIVVPEDAASAALTARPGATLLDRAGNKLFGRELEAPNSDYAGAVIERAIAIPQGLTYFTERFHDAPSAASARTVQIAYNLAFAFAEPADRRGEILQKYLPKAAERFGPGLQWNQLIRDSEWEAFPAEAIVDQLLVDSRDLSPARRELLCAVEAGAAVRKLRVDARLAEWWRAEDRGKAIRLAELLAHEPRLVDEGLAAERLAGIPLEQFPESLRYAVIRAEANSGRLANRAQQSADLAHAAVDWTIFQILTDAVSNGRLEPDWARAYVRLTEANVLIDAACRWLANPQFFEPAWGNVPRNLLDRLRALELPSSLTSLVRETGLRLTVAENLEVYLRLADVLARIDPREPALTQRLWRSLSQVTDPHSRAFLEGIVFDEAWTVVRVESLDLPTLLQLGCIFQKDESLDRLYVELDRRMRLDPEATSTELARTGWWYFWRWRSQLQRSDVADAEILRRSALAWLSADGWSNGSGRPATLEAWREAVEDVPQLTGEQFMRLRDPSGARWPWISPFEDEQLTDLIARATDLGALAELVDAVDREQWSPPDGTPIAEWVRTMSNFKSDVTPGAFAWLIDRRHGRRRDVLTLEQSDSLWKRAGHRRSQALEARIEAVANRFDDDMEGAIAAANEPSLWSDGQFLARVATWVNDKRSLSAIGQTALAQLEDRIGGIAASRPASPSLNLVGELVDQGFDRIARLVHPERQAAMRADELSSGVIDAMLTGRVEDPVWPRLVAQLRGQSSEGRHAFTALAERIREKRRSCPDEWRELSLHGWKTFVAAAGVHPELTNALSTPPLPDSSLLPLLEISASILGSGALGSAVLQIVFAARPMWRSDTKCWRGLLQAMRTYRRHGDVASPDDRESAALALVSAHLGAEKEQDAFKRALMLEAKDWPVAQEFGEKSP
jgi:hypothetical protein